MKISIMITTHNRLTDLQRTCEVISSLIPEPLEVLITADGCNDGTVEYIQNNYPSFRLIVNENGKGSVASRASMMNKASGDLVLSLDDDSYPEQLDCLATLSKIFEDNPKLAIASFPQRTEKHLDTLTQKDFGLARPVRSFANCAACLRVLTYKDLPGFEPIFFHMYEEPDYALQCIANNWQVYYFPDITIRHHFSSVGRSLIRNHHLQARNSFWSVLLRCPLPYCVPIAIYKVFSEARLAYKRQGFKWLMQEPNWWWQALKKLSSVINKRRPLSWDGYRSWLTYS